MKEIFEAFVTRIKSPVFGYFILSWVAFNWKPLFYLFFSNTLVDDRFQYFDKCTTWHSLSLFPLLTASAIALIYPWVNFLFLFACKKPIDLRNFLQAESENRLLLKKKQLEDARSAFLSTKERDLIERAKRDEEVKAIADEDTKERLQEEIQLLRKEIDSNKNITNNTMVNIDTKKNLAHSYKQMADMLTKKGQLAEAENYLKLAIQIESELANIL